MDVSVIIVNYNTLELTKNTSESVFEKTRGLKYEIILVDNASTDGSVEFFERSYQEKIILIKNKENLGFGKANNIGAKEAKGKYLFLLNSDTLLINNAIKILFDFMEKNNKCGVCGGNLYDAQLFPTFSYKKKMMGYESELKEPLIFGLISIISKKLKKYDWSNPFFNFSDNNLKVELIIGADFFIRREIFEKLTGFDEDFFMYHEESELCFRVLKLGYSIYNVPAAKIIHLEGQSSRIKLEKFKIERKSKYLFFYKTKGISSLKYAYILSQIYYLIYSVYKKEKELLRINKKIYLEIKRKDKRK